jgi:uncharacterized protein YdhG (YjbR/CyaY superfamily)
MQTVDEYFASLPPGSRNTLQKLRRTIKALVPRATEVISYQLPTFKDGRMLVAYGAFSDHCSFFPLSSAVTKRFAKELARYDTSPGTIRFPIDKPLPASLVKKIVKARIEQNKFRDKISGKSKRKTHAGRAKTH